MIGLSDNVGQGMARAKHAHAIQPGGSLPVPGPGSVHPFAPKGLSPDISVQDIPLTAEQQAHKQATHGLQIDDLGHKWSTTSAEVPNCAACDIRIEGSDLNDKPRVPVRLTRKICGVWAELCLCPACFKARLIK